MALTSTDIHEQSFKVDRRGYNVDEVDVFLEHVAKEVDVLNEQISLLTAQHQELQAELMAAREAAAACQTETQVVHIENNAQAEARIHELERKLEERKMDDNAIAKALIVAQRSGDELIAKAKTEADGMIKDAEEEAKRILDKASTEKQRILDTISNLQTDREVVRGEYQDLLKDFISSASKKLAELGGDLDTSSFAQPTGRMTPAADAAPAARPVSSVVATYTTPQASPVVVTPNPPKPSKPEKDLSGFGDADDAFEFGDVE